jgi:predicted GNAT family acetyltransferase
MNRFPNREAPVEIVDNPVAQQYEARVGAQVVGYTEYRHVRGRIIFIHTEVDPAMEGKGIGSALARGALDDVRARGLRFSVKCPFIGAWLRRHPEYDDIRVELGQ